jgi:hypothetical protein
MANSANLMRPLTLKPRDRAEVYDRLYVLACKLLVAGKACASCPLGSEEEHFSMIWCCSGCKYSSDKGCTTQALACKLWLCDDAHTLEVDRRRARQLNLRIMLLKRIASHYNVHVARASKEESLEHGYEDLWFLYPNSGEQ